MIHPIGAELNLVAGGADVVFTSASAFSLEFIVWETPASVVCAVDNQEDYYEQLGRLGYASQIGVRTSNGTWDFEVEAIEELLMNESTRHSLRNKILVLIDLEGGARVFNMLTSSTQAD